MAQGEEGSRRNMSIFQGFETWHWAILAKSPRDAIPAPQLYHLWVLTLSLSQRRLVEATQFAAVEAAADLA